MDSTYLDTVGSAFSSPRSYATDGGVSSIGSLEEAMALRKNAKRTPGAASNKEALAFLLRERALLEECARKAGLRLATFEL